MIQQENQLSMISVWIQSKSTNKILDNNCHCKSCFNCYHSSWIFYKINTIAFVGHTHKICPKQMKLFALMRL